ncbi:MAG: type II toxin-antitoxin system VapC family toxin [Desulfococcaceae bacterium]
MKFLLDTHIFIWWILDNPKLSGEVITAVKNPHNFLYLSIASIWEIVIKSSICKIVLPESPEIFIRKQMWLNSVSLLHIKIDHAFEVLRLPMIHKDPFDRMLIAQANCEDLTLITDDLFIRQYEVKIF